MKDTILSNLLAKFAGKRILVVGDVMMDETISGKVQRVSQEAPVPVVEIADRTRLAGGAANAAANVVALGGRAVLLGVVGNDRQAEQLREALCRQGVEAEGLVVDAQRPTTTKTRIVAQGQQIVRVDHERRTPLSTQVENAVLQRAKGCLLHADACVVSDYDKGVVSSRLAKRLISMARQARKPVIVDPKGTDYTKYRGATVITPNLQEAQRALIGSVSEQRATDGSVLVAEIPISSPEVDVLRIGQLLLEVLDGSAVLITRGSQGMSLFRRGARPAYIPAEARHVFDVTGAGDTVVSTLSLALAAVVPLEQAVQLANQAAGIVVGKFGTATVTPEDLANGMSVAKQMKPHLAAISSARQAGNCPDDVRTQIIARRESISQGDRLG